MNESFDIKRMLICLKQKLHLIILTTIIGAILCGGIYLVVRMISMPIKYQSHSQFYLQFIYDPSGEVEQYYNGFTWNTLLHADPILNHIAAALKTLPDGKKILAGKPDTDENIKERFRDNLMQAALLSDRRILTIFFTSDDKEINNIAQQAVEIGLINYAIGAHEIISMELIRSTEPQLYIWDNHLHRAIIGGAVLFFLLAMFGWWFYHILDDSLYTIADAEKRYPYPVLGILLKDESLTFKTPYFAEFSENMAHIIRKKKAHFLSVEDIPYPDGDVLRKSDGVILKIPFGRRNGKLVERCISYLKNQDVEILGLYIENADENFLRYYYWGKKVK